MGEPVGQTRRETRESTKHKLVWKQPSTLDAPEPPPGYKYRWVRHTTRGEPDDLNVIGRKNQYYEPVMASEIDQTDQRVLAMEDGRYDGVVKTKDLILMKVPEEIVEQREAHFRDVAAKLRSSTTNDLRREVNKSGMKYADVIDESRTQVHTGKRPQFQEE